MAIIFRSKSKILYRVDKLLKISIMKIKEIESLSKFKIKNVDKDNIRGGRSLGGSRRKLELKTWFKGGHKSFEVGTYIDGFNSGLDCSRD